MHASLTASAPWILLPAVTGTSLVYYYLALIVAIWIVVAVVYARNLRGGEQRRQSASARA